MENKLNDKQQKFMDTVTNEPHTLAELSKMAGIEFKTGSINILVKKNLVKHGEDKIITCELCGHKHKVKTWMKI